MMDWVRDVKEWVVGRELSRYPKKGFLIIWESGEANKLEAFLDCKGVEQTQALHICDYENSDYEKAVKTLIGAREKLPNLKGINLGSGPYLLNQQTDLKPILDAFPALEELHVAGAKGLKFSQSRHICLKKLVIEGEGLGEEIVAGIAESVFPELEHLELPLGDKWDGSEATFQQLLYIPFPSLTYLKLTHCLIPPSFDFQEMIFEGGKGDSFLSTEILHHSSQDHYGYQFEFEPNQS